MADLSRMTGIEVFHAVVKLPSKRWWIPVGARLEGPKLEPEEPRAELGFPTADQGLSSIQGTLVVDPSKMVPYLKCEVHDPLLEVVDLKQEMLGLRSGGILPV